MMEELKHLGQLRLAELIEVRIEVSFAIIAMVD